MTIAFFIALALLVVETVYYYNRITTLEECVQRQKVLMHAQCRECEYRKMVGRD